jgi:hypothetical protein
MMGGIAATPGGEMSAARALVAGVVLFSLGAAACTSDEASEVRARADQAEARVETLEADLVEAEIALAEAQAEAAGVTAMVRRLEADLAALQGGLREKELLLATTDRALTTLQEEHQAVLGDLADLNELYYQLEARVDFDCPLPSDGLPVQALPAAVAETRTRIHAAAVACDWLELHRLAEEAGGIAYADGAVGWHGDPVPWWLTNPGEIRLLAGILELSFGTYQTTDESGNTITVYIWPAVILDEHQSEADWAELRRVYSDEEIQRIRTSEGYLGFAVTIRADGSWKAALHVSV